MGLSKLKSPYVRQNLTLAWPLALNAILMQSMLMIDVLLVSPLGEISLAAMGIATTIIAFILGLQMALANGSQLVLSRAVGAGGGSALGRGLGAGVVLNVMVAVPFWLLLTLAANPISSALANDPQVVIQIVSYLDIAKYVVLLNAVTQVVIALFNALGHTKVPFHGYLLELPINVVASFALIHGIGQWHGVGLQGAAMGSLLAIMVRLGYLCWRINKLPQQTLAVALVVAVDSGDVPRSWPSSWLSSLWLRLRRLSLWRHWCEIFPIAANVAMLQAGVMLYQLLFSQLALHAYVAITVVMPWIRVGTQFITAWAHASAIAVSQAIGARQLTTLRHKVDASIDVAVTISVLVSLLLLGLSLVIAHVYPKLDAQTYLALATIAPLYVLLPLARGYNTVHGHALRALGKTMQVFKINFAGQWLFALPLCALIILVWDGSAFWAFAVMPLEELAKMVPFRRLARRTLAEFDEAKAAKLMYD